MPFDVLTLPVRLLWARAHNCLSSLVVLVCAAWCRVAPPCHNRCGHALFPQVALKTQPDFRRIVTANMPCFRSLFRAYVQINGPRAEDGSRGLGFPDLVKFAHAFALMPQICNLAQLRDLFTAVNFAADTYAAPLLPVACCLLPVCVHSACEGDVVGSFGFVRNVWLFLNAIVLCGNGAWLLKSYLLLQSSVSYVVACSQGRCHRGRVDVHGIRGLHRAILTALPPHTVRSNASRRGSMVLLMLRIRCRHITALSCYLPCFSQTHPVTRVLLPLG